MKNYIPVHYVYLHAKLGAMIIELCFFNWIKKEKKKNIVIL